jgi:tRNA(Ile)-lysidine synthase
LSRPLIMLNLETRVLRTIREYGMIKPEDHVLVAVSGGPDSLALLHCLFRLASQLHIKLTVAHLNHRLRGAEADADESFVRAAGRSLGLDVITESIDIGEQAAAAKANLEEWARRIRYQFLWRTADGIGAARIAVGHTISDQAETVLLRLFRGSGSAGVSGIYPVVDGVVIRPLLECSRREILTYLQAYRIDYREDATNRDTNRMRNRIRHDLIPYLERFFNPQIAKILAREAAIARVTTDYLEDSIEALFQDLRVDIPNGLYLPAEKLSELHPAASALLLRRALRQCRGSLTGISARHIHDLLRLCRPGTSGRRLLIPGPVVVRREFENLVFQRPDPVPNPEFCYTLPIPGRCVIEEIGMEFVAEEGIFENSAVPQAISAGRALLNPALLPRELMIRTRRLGDRYGGGRHRKVKKMLIDAGISASIRDMMPLVVAGAAVVWIPGFRPARAFRSDPASAPQVRVEVRSKK